LSANRKIDKVGYAAHHLIPGNEMWNDKGHPLHEWIHAAKGKVKGDIGYENNHCYNGIDLPSHFLVSGWGGMSKQEGYAYAAMTADTKKRQFHDAHKAYSDLVWNALVKIAEKLDALVKSKGCGKRNCPAGGGKKYDPPYQVLPQLINVATRLRGRVWGPVSMWKPPIMTSRFALMYKNGGIDQEEAREKLAKMREEMGSPTG
jgi:hypothetical protein